MTHEQRVKKVAAQVRTVAAGGQPLVFAKKSVSHMVPNPLVDGARAPEVDLRDLDNILHIDPAARVCIAEPGVTFKQLVSATLALGLMPTTVPELEAITIGGAVSGCSVESLSYRYGGFHDSCLEYEYVTGDGRIATCSREQNPEVFEMLHGAYGTLGILTKLTFRLLPAKPYVRMTYTRFERFDDFWQALRDHCEGDGRLFVDGIIHGPHEHVLCVGEPVDSAPYATSYAWRNIYYKSTRERAEDYLRTADYFFRYDTEAHWLSRTLPPLETRVGRFVLGPFFLGSTNLLRWSKRLAPIFRRIQRRPDVVVDVFIPESRFSAFYAWYERVFDFWPLWVIPYRLPHAYPWIADEHQARMKDRLMIDCAIYGKPNSEPHVDYSELMEQKVHELGGIKTLISRNHYDRETFWSIYSRPRWQAVKQTTDPHNLLGDLYDRMHPREAR